MAGKDTTQHQGLIIPHVAMWSSEADMYCAYDRDLGRKALFSRGRQGEGRPILGQMEPSRQRAVVQNWLCQVCAKPLGRIALMARQVNLMTSEGEAILEPASCWKCFQYAAANCPGLKRHQYDVLGVTGPHRILAALVKPGGNLTNDPEAVGAVSYLKVIPAIVWRRPWELFLAGRVER